MFPSFAGASAFGGIRQGDALFAQGRYEQAATQYFLGLSDAKNKQELRRAEWGLARSLLKQELWLSASKTLSSPISMTKSP